MSLPQLKHPGYTIEDWKTWEGHWELIGGVAYAMAPPNLEHQRISSRLHIALGNALADVKRKHDGSECEVFSAPCGLFLPGAENAVEPDLMVVCDPAKKSARGIEGAPDLVVEILSPSTGGRDWSIKRWAYEAAGVPEYLIVDPDEQLGVLLRLEGGRFEEAARIEWGSVMSLLSGKLNITLG